MRYLKNSNKSLLSQANNHRRGSLARERTYKQLPFLAPQHPAVMSDKKSPPPPHAGCGQESLMEKQEFHHSLVLTKPVPLQYPSTSTRGKRKKEKAPLARYRLRSSEEPELSALFPSLQTPLGHGGQAENLGRHPHGQ